MEKQVKKASKLERTLNSLIFFTILGLLTYLEVSLSIFPSGITSKIIGFIVSWGLAYLVTLATVYIASSIASRAVFVVGYIGILAFVLTQQSPF